MVKRKGFSTKQKVQLYGTVDNALQDQSTADKKTTLDDKDKVILNLVVRQAALTDGDISKQVGLSRQTVNERRNHPLFVAALARIRDEQSKTAIELLQDAVPVCVRVLVQIAKDKTANESARVSAAKAVLDKTLPSKMENFLKGALTTHNETKGAGTLEEMYNGLNGKDKKQFLATITGLLAHKRP